MLNESKIAKKNDFECWEWTGFKNRDGYGVVHVKSKLFKTHRVAYCAAHKKSLEDIAQVVVRHSCDNRACVNPAHLLLGSSADNTQDRHARNRDAKGSVNGNSKLTEDQVKTLRSEFMPWSRTCGARPLAAKYGVSASLVSQIVNRVIWTHI